MTNERKKITLEDIAGIIDIPPLEGRFHDILSTQKILDTTTGIEYDGLVDRDFLELVNEIVDKLNKLSEENEQLKQDIEYLKGQLKAYSEVCPNGCWVLNKGDVE